MKNKGPFDEAIKVLDEAIQEFGEFDTEAQESCVKAIAVLTAAGSVPVHLTTGIGELGESRYGAPYDSWRAQQALLKKAIWEAGR